MSLKHLNGVFAVAKPQGWTSRQVVDHVKYGLLALRATGRGVRSAAKKLSASRVLKIGHGGTLDPLATGVLVIGLGKGTKQLQSYLHGYKTYEVSLVLGSATDTYDSTGKVTARSSTEHVTKRLVLETLQQFRGETWQVPPIYSALKINGQRLYALARSNTPLPQDYTIQKRKITISDIQLTSYHPPSLSDNSHKTPPSLSLRVTCGGGAYMRSLVHDLGLAMSTHAHMTALCRLQQGPFTLQDTLTLDEAIDVDRVLAVQR